MITALLIILIMELLLVIRRKNKEIEKNKYFKDLFTNKYVDDELLSECCGMKRTEGTDLCSKCNEHTGQHNN